MTDFEKTMRGQLLQFGTHLFTSVELDTRLQLALTVASELKQDGHAVIVDETFNSARRFVELRIFHYQTCRLCARVKPGAVA